jgi:hypothetical protein
MSSYILAVYNTVFAYPWGFKTTIKQINITLSDIMFGVKQSKLYLFVFLFVILAYGIVTPFVRSFTLYDVILIGSILMHSIYFAIFLPRANYYHKLAIVNFLIFLILFTRCAWVIYTVTTVVHTNLLPKVANHNVKSEMFLPKGYFGCVESPCTCPNKNQDIESTQAPATPAIVRIPEAVPSVPLEVLPSSSRLPENPVLRPVEVISAAASSYPIPAITSAMTTSVKISTCGRAGTIALIGPVLEFVDGIQTGATYRADPHALLENVPRGKLYSERYTYPVAIASNIPAAVAEPIVGAHGVTHLVPMEEACPNCKNAAVTTTSKLSKNENGEPITLYTDTHDCYANHERLGKIKYTYGPYEKGNSSCTIQ